VLVLCGGAVLRISLFSELYLRYVQQGLRPFLIVSGVLLVLLGLFAAVADGRPPHDDQDRDEDEEGDRGEGEEEEDEEDEHEDRGGGHSHGHGHDHGHGPRVAWLLTVPALALLFFPPPALGSYSAEREAATYAARGVGAFPPLPRGEPVDLTLGQFTSRAMYDSGRTMTGRTIRMTGFVTGSGDTWYLTRLLISCCAADARPNKAEIRGVGAPAADSWVTVTGTWIPEGTLGTDEAWPPVLEGTSVRQVEQPGNPYEKR
jgi:uncharacterized repeat protein (TIGR03943 family)